MSREILFRGKRDPEYGTGWCYGVPFTDYEGNCIMVTHNTQRAVIEDTVGQYTGLTDRNGVKIFEGDILVYPCYMNRVVGYICWVKNSVCFMLRSLYDVYGDTNGNFEELLLGYVEKSEVVGNIYDNPELLKGEENA